MAYLTQTRIRKAIHCLHASNESIAQIANRVGYESETAFKNAFKKQFGIPPGQFRKESKNVTAVASTPT